MYKNSELTHVLSQKYLEVIPHEGNYHVSFKFLLVLLLIEQGSNLEKYGGKGDLIKTSGSGRSNVVCVILNKIVAVYMRLISKHI